MGNCRMLWIHALTPIHVGCGFGVGAVDLPIIREKVSNWPVLPGSGLKGVLADHYGASIADKRGAIECAAFGRPDGNFGEELVSSNAGALIVSDARLILLPIRSLFGTWAWITCPMALRRLLRDLEETGQKAGLTLTDVSPGEQGILVPQGIPSKLKKASPSVFIADLDLVGVENSGARIWAEKLASWLFPKLPDGTESPWVTEFVSRFGIVHEDLFNYLVENGVEIATRIRVSPATGTVAKGQLWTEESIPAESVFASIVWADKVKSSAGNVSRESILSTYCQSEIPALQIGGKATVGRGRARAVFSGE